MSATRECNRQQQQCHESCGCRQSLIRFQEKLHWRQKKRLVLIALIAPVREPLRRGLQDTNDAAPGTRGTLSKVTDSSGWVRDLKIKVEHESCSVHLLIRALARVVLVLIVGIEFDALADW